MRPAAPLIALAAVSGLALAFLSTPAQSQTAPGGGGGIGTGAPLTVPPRTGPRAGEASEPVRLPDRAAYAIGHRLGLDAREGLERDEVKCSREAVLRGFSDALLTGASAMTPAEMEDALIALQREVGERQAQQRLANDPVFKAVADENLKRSRQFLDRFSKKEGAKSLDGGVFYLPIKSGSGQLAKSTDTVVITYQIKLTTGEEIASAVDQPVRIASVPQGSQTVLTRMKPGDRWLVAIPPELAFGVAGRAPAVGPNETIVADVEFIRLHE